MYWEGAKKDGVFKVFVILNASLYESKMYGGGVGKECFDNGMDNLLCLLVWRLLKCALMQHERL